MKPSTLLAPLLLLLVASAGTASAADLVPSPTCDRACLYRVLDGYLAALKAHDTRKVIWAARVKNTENNVEIRPGDGLWGTITGVESSYEMRFADPVTGNVAVFGVLEETTTKSPYAMRIQVRNGAISEVETIVVRPEDAGIPFVNAKIAPVPVWNEMVPAAQRTPRQRMVDVANGYFDTLQLNDGTLHTAFTDDCNRRENGTVSTNLKEPGLDPLWNLGCADQFRKGAYRYDDRLRDRRYMMVDEERGIVLSAGFIDHEGRLAEFTLTDGSKRTPIFRRPHSFVFLEAFKIVEGKIRQIEANFLTVPYNMPSPWTRGSSTP